MSDRARVLLAMQDEIREWAVEKGWRGEGSAPVTFGDTMALLHSEVSEALEAYRDHGLADATESVDDPGCLVCGRDNRNGTHAALEKFGHLGHPFRPYLAKPEGVGSEFADVLIRLLDDCDRWGVDIAAEYERKMAYNRTRSYQHGGRRL